MNRNLEGYVHDHIWLHTVLLGPLGENKNYRNIHTGLRGFQFSAMGWRSTPNWSSHKSKMEMSKLVYIEHLT